MNTSLILLTLMRNSQKIKVNVSKILSYKHIVLGCGSILSLSERIDGSKTVLVDESVYEIDELISKVGTQKKEVLHTPSIDCLRFSGNGWISKVHLPSLKHLIIT